jgi:cellulose synthase/poly-beta-1,6-N-acetylglucosamine synthase-like glycosyltransferase
MRVGDEPTVTVIMPIRNERAWIQRSLGAVLAQQYPMTSVEILIADGMSDDGTRQELEKVAGGLPNVRVIENSGSIVASGFNSCLRQAAGDIIVRIDGHTVVAPDYIRSCVEELARTGAANVGGRMTVVGSGVFGRATALAMNSWLGSGGAAYRNSKGEGWTKDVYLGAWRRSVLTQVGSMDEEMIRNQDDELNYRIRENGGRIYLSSRIRSVYAARETPTRLWIQYYKYGYWKVRVMQKHPRQMQVRQFAPPLFVLVVAALAARCLLSDVCRVTLALLFGLYALINLGASAWISIRSAFAGFPLLACAFGIMHVSYGIGFVHGMAAFCDRWRHPKVHNSPVGLGV